MVGCVPSRVIPPSDRCDNGPTVITDVVINADITLKYPVCYVRERVRISKVKIKKALYNVVTLFDRVAETANRDGV